METWGSLIRGCQEWGTGSLPPSGQWESLVMGQSWSRTSIVIVRSLGTGIGVGTTVSSLAAQLSVKVSGLGHAALASAGHQLNKTMLHSITTIHIHHTITWGNPAHLNLWGALRHQGAASIFVRGMQQDLYFYVPPLNCLLPASFRTSVWCPIIALALVNMPLIFQWGHPYKALSGYRYPTSTFYRYPTITLAVKCGDETLPCGDDTAPTVC